MKKMELKILLEIVSEIIWHQDEFFNKGVDSDRILSFFEKNEVAEYLLEMATVDDNAVAFKENNNQCYEIKAYNYFVLLNKTEDEPESVAWKIMGFDSFDMASEIYMDYHQQTAIFVKDGCTYKEVEIEYMVESRNGKSVSLNEVDFYFDDEYRRKKYKRYIISKGVCEFHNNNGIYCRCVGSISEMSNILWSFFTECLLKYEEKVLNVIGDYYEQYDEDGTVYFEGDIFRYYMYISHDESGYKLFDSNNQEYCHVRNCFMKSKEKLCGIMNDDCNECMEIFPIDSDIGVVDELCCNAKWIE